MNQFAQRQILYEAKLQQEYDKKRQSRQAKLKERDRVEALKRKMVYKDREFKLRHMCGYLHKKGHLVKNWKTRWFRIDGDRMVYFKQSNEAWYRGEFELRNGTATEIPMTEGRAHCFKIHAYKGKEKWQGKEFILAAPSEEERQLWVDAVRLVTSELKVFSSFIA